MTGPKLHTLAQSPLGNGGQAAARHPRASDPHDHVKGVAIAAVLQAFAQKRGADRLRAVLEGLAPEQLGDLDPSLANGGVLASKWYPSAFVHAVVDGMCEGLNDAERQLLAEQMEGAVMDATLHGVHKLFFRLLVTPERFAHYSQPLWTRFYDSGQLESRVDDDVVTSRVVNWRGYHCFLCRMNREASRIIHTAMGRRVTHVTATECRAAGDAACTSQVFLEPQGAE